MKTTGTILTILAIIGLLLGMTTAIAQAGPYVPGCHSISGGNGVHCHAPDGHVYKVRCKSGFHLEPPGGPSARQKCVPNK